MTELTSLGLAKLSYKPHKHVLRDIRSELRHLTALKSKESLRVLSGFTKASYKDAKGQYRPYYTLTPETFFYLSFRYSPIVRCKVACFLTESGADVSSICKHLDSKGLGDTSSVYVIKELKTSRRKIGISKDPEERLKCLQIGNSHRLDLEYCSKPIANAREIELRLHKAFQEFSVGGEWFTNQLPIQEVLQTIASEIEKESPDEL